MVQGCRAREVIESFPLTSENSEKEIEALKNRFETEELLIEFYDHELLALVIQNATERSVKSTCTLVFNIIMGVSGLLGPTLMWNITRIQICIATYGQKRFRSTLDDVVHKSIGGNRDALPQSFELPSPALDFETVLRIPGW
ncbi:hypothetical protein TNCV_1030811 [Trichonephila clavipes]|nr:hypothetical protein TNCV_1030811 [Trichonephila clavipes]